MSKQIKQIYEIFEEIDFSECKNCNCSCCYFPWLLKEEYGPHQKNFGNEIKQIDSVAFIMDKTSCKFAKCDRCHIYKDRPIDCRLFPLDIIEEGGVYHWCIFLVCPKHKEIRNKLISLIPSLEKSITPEMFAQYKKQISITKELYPPYKNKQYEKICVCKLT